MQNNYSFGHYDRIVIHTPHAGTILPIQYRTGHPSCKWTNQLIRESVNRFYKPLTDHYTDKLFCFVALGQYELTGSSYRIEHVSFPYSRLFCDVERMENDPLEERGLGIHYDLNRYLEYGDAHIHWIHEKEVAMKLYNEHQETLSKAVRAYIKTLLLDCHSFSEQNNILCPDAHKFKDIDICIGFNEDETKPSGEFIDSIKNFFTACGYRVEFNKPFSNSKTVKGYCNWVHPYNTLMIEVNKHCYMNEDTLAITAGYYKLHSELQILYNLLLNS